MDKKMRIVGRNRDGNYYVKSKAFDSEHTAIQRALERLYTYEELELSPSEIEVMLEELESAKRALYKIAKGELKNLESLRRIVAETAPKEGESWPEK